MNILITGATGFIGRHLCARMKELYNIYALVRPSSSCDKLICPPTYVFDENISSLACWMQNMQIDGVVHLAAFQAFSPEEGEIKDLVLSNIWLGTALLEACKKADVKWFLNTGTIWQNYQSPDFLDVYNPVNLYAASKQAFLSMAKYYTETSSIRFCTLKLCDTYGPGDTRKKILSLFDEARQTGCRLDLTPGKQQIDLLHINDVVSGFVRLTAILADQEFPVCPEYDLSSGKRISLRNLAVLYEKKYHTKLNICWGAIPYRERTVMIPYKGNILPGWSPIITEQDLYGDEIPS